MKTPSPKDLVATATMALLLAPTAALVRSPCVDRPIPNATEAITDRLRPQDTVVDPDRILDCALVPVGADDGASARILRDPDNPYRGAPSHAFYAADDSVNRVELTTAFATQGDLDAAGLSAEEIADRQAAKSLYHYGSGFATFGEWWTYEYGLYLPSSLDGKSKGIVSQWHGVPDRTTVMAPDGNITTYTLEEFNDNVLTSMYFTETTGYDIETDEPNGYSVDQGGYPPLALKVGEGHLYLVARADRLRITDKEDRVNISPPRTRTKKSKDGTKEICSPYMERLEDLPSDEWIQVRFDLIFSEWKEDGSGMLNDGRIKMHLDGEEVVDWRGPLGSNDAVAPYFKYGIYKPGEDGMSVSLAGLKYSKTSEWTDES